MNNLIGLAGKKRAGKDSAASVLTKELGYTRVAFADSIKKILEDLNPIIDADYSYRLMDVLEWYEYDWELLKARPEVRGLMQRLGVAVRQFDEGFWVEAALHNAEKYSRIVVTDVRFPNEVDAVLEKGGVVYRVVRPGLESTDWHISETALDHLDLPVILNDGSVEDLYAKVRELAS